MGRLDPKLERDGAARRLTVRSLYLEPAVEADDALLAGLSDALRDLARFLGAAEVAIGRSEPEDLAPALAERLAAPPTPPILGGL